MMALFLLLNIAAPATDDVRAMNYVIPIVPRITGQVTEVPIQPNRPIKKGDVLFKIDPVPFEAAVKAAEATLRGLQDQLKNATAKKAALTPRIDLAKKRVEQFTALAATGAGKRADLEQAQSDLGNLESEFLAADATEAQAGAQIIKAEADLRSAKFDLEGCVHVAPANGRVANLSLQPGVRATQFATMPVMSFIQEDDPWLLDEAHHGHCRRTASAHARLGKIGNATISRQHGTHRGQFRTAQVGFCLYDLRPGLRFRGVGGEEFASRLPRSLAPPRGRPASQPLFARSIRGVSAAFLAVAFLS